MAAAQAGKAVHNMESGLAESEKQRQPLAEQPQAASMVYTKDGTTSVCSRVVDGCEAIDRAACSTHPLVSPGRHRQTRIESQGDKCMSIHNKSKADSCVNKEAAKEAARNAETVLLANEAAARAKQERRWREDLLRAGSKSDERDDNVVDSGDRRKRFVMIAQRCTTMPSVHSLALELNEGLKNICRWAGEIEDPFRRSNGVSAKTALGQIARRPLSTSERASLGIMPT
eukprot:SAG31_NODE_5349_length_2593_cov_2.007217_1_plen_229_part_00